MSNQIPCLICISYAICQTGEILRCNVLENYVVDLPSEYGHKRLWMEINQVLPYAGMVLHERKGPFFKPLFHHTNQVKES